MDNKMDFEDAPRDHLQTWGHMKTLTTWTCVLVTGILAIMAATLTP